VCGGEGCHQPEGRHQAEHAGGGLHRVAWADLAITDHWRRYLSDPSAYLRHLIDP
jgi:hypothetical protein